MKDELKNRVDKDRPAWDIYEADLEGLWDSIEDRLDKPEPGKEAINSRAVWMKIAASIVITFGITWFVFTMYGEVDAAKNGYALRDISADLAETEIYYATMISDKLEMIRKSNADVDVLVFENLALLDSAYNELKLDLKDNVDNEEVVGAMIENYRIKLEILEQILREINRDEHENDEMDEINI